MTFLDSMERRFGHLAIPGLIRIVVLLNAFIFLLSAANPHAIELLAFNRHAIFTEGEYWRLFTFLFIPQTTSPFFLLIALWFLWSIGGALDVVWGAFRLNLFYFTGAFFTIVAAIFFGGTYSNVALNVTLLFVYARFFPNVMLLFPPIPVKWAAWVFGAFTGLGMISGDPAYRGAVLAMAVTYLIFFVPEMLRARRQQEDTARRRRKFEAASLPEEEALHRCATCGRTERSHPDLDFRVSRDGSEYCTEHLPRPAAR